MSPKYRKRFRKHHNYENYENRVHPLKALAFTNALLIRAQLLNRPSYGGDMMMTEGCVAKMVSVVPGPTNINTALAFLPSTGRCRF